MSLRPPESLRFEHDKLHAELLAATRAGGEIGQAAQEVATLLHPHFEKEERFALPPLALLAPLARGEPVADSEEAISLSARLKQELPAMLIEHEAIIAALTVLMAAAQKAGQAKWARFATDLMHHARTEEELLYPAAILVGEYLKRQIEAAID